jgi:hypothetical protein
MCAYEATLVLVFSREPNAVARTKLAAPDGVMLAVRPVTTLVVDVAETGVAVDTITVSNANPSIAKLVQLPDFGRSGRIGWPPPSTRPSRTNSSARLSMVVPYIQSSRGKWRHRVSG